MQFDSRHQTDRLRSVRSCNCALRENGRSIESGRFLCAEGQAVPSSRWTGLVEAVTSPDQKGNRDTNRAPVVVQRFLRLGLPARSICVS